MLGAYGRQKRASNPLDLDADYSELPRRQWELNLGPLEEQLMLSTTDPSIWFLSSIMVLFYNEVEDM